MLVEALSTARDSVVLEVVGNLDRGYYEERCLHPMKRL